MIKFVLNNKTVETDEPKGMTLLDFIRYKEHLKGTKIGCREGDCGACTCLVGEKSGEQVSYKSVTSCITPLGNAQGKHVVTVEGINMEQLNPVQSAMVENSGTQCGFCTPGFVMSLTGYCMSNQEVSMESAISAIDGNICRCTGYKSIERATKDIAGKLSDKNLKNPVGWAIQKGYIPEYFSTIPKRLSEIETIPSKGKVIVGGGTDLYVQKHDSMHHADVNLVSDNIAFKGILVENGICYIGASTTATEMMESNVIKTAFPNIYEHLKLVSSTPIRNIGTVAGNLVNASPIGDLTCFFLALNANVVLKNYDNETERVVALNDFYKGYKILDKKENEYLIAITFSMPTKETKFHFEKVSKRKYLDIASFNTAISIQFDGKTIKSVHVSAGGVGPTPKYLSETGSFLTGKIINAITIKESAEIIQKEISPISDVRGTEAYKRLLLRQLYFSHFIKLFPELIKAEDLV